MSRPGDEADPDPAAVSEIRQAGLAPLRDFIAYAEEFLRLVQPWQQWDGEPSEDIINRMPEPERTDARRIYAHLEPVLEDRRRARRQDPPDSDPA